MQMTESHIEDEMQDDEFMRDYKDKPGSIPHLPPSSERLLLEAVNSSRIVDIQELVFQRYKYDYIGVSASFIIDWSWEAVYHHSYVLRKDSDALSWASAKVYEYIDGDPIILLYC